MTAPRIHAVAPVVPPRVVPPRVVPPRVVVVGDTVLDHTWNGSATRLCPDSVGPVVDLESEGSSPGAAALTAIAAARLGCETTLVTALAGDSAARRVRRHLAGEGVELVDLGLEGPTPEKLRLRADGITVTRADRHCQAIASVHRGLDVARPALMAADAVILSDYGRGLIESVWRDDSTGDTTPIVWDPHPRSRRPKGRVTVATPNRAEAARLSGATGDDPHRSATVLAHDWDCAVAVTCGSSGVVVGERNSTYRIAVEPVAGDACGAGDWFVAGIARALCDYVALPAAIEAGRDAAATWLSRPSSTSSALGSDPTVVATSGCFDVLHVGHLAMLEHARALGDRLVVLLNGDESVRLLKGSGRPVNGVDDRADLLLGLACVDEVRVFDESTPCAALERLRPAVFVKGADYAGLPLEEATAMARWGGRVEFAPLVSGRSTTRVLRLARSLAE